MASQHPQSTRCNGDIAGGAGAASNNGVLPNQDVLFEILQRIPARPLCRFRAVCKSWRSLLSDLQFAVAHAARHSGDPLFAVCAIDGTYSHDTFTEIRLVDTSVRAVKRVKVGPTSRCQMLPHLDLVLLCGMVSVDVGVERHALRVLDLATGAVSILPSNNEDIYCSFVLGRAMSSTGEHGEYKVLSLTTLVNPKQWPFRVLTLDGSGGTWRAAPKPPVSIRTFINGSAVAIKGIIYHLVHKDSWSIAAFDLEAEQWWPSLVQVLEEPMPSIIDAAHPLLWRRSLAEMNERLAAVSTTSSAMDIWLLMGSGEQGMWLKQCRICMSSIQQDVKPLSMLEDGRVVLWVRTYTRTGALWIYDPRTKSHTRVVIIENCNIGVGLYTRNLLR
ncbi:unnamed protein product [Urochloa decumbens]|uniref:F-box domain-containing protein n=1 Tax=Urochloa decumbens TaxID=240449 RepID=A0ABC9FNP7_9POAL